MIKTRFNASDDVGFRQALYHPKMTTLQHLAENNFKLLTYLLPSDARKPISYQVWQQSFELKIIEETNYTMLVSLSWVSRLNQKNVLTIASPKQKDKTTTESPSINTTLFIRVYFDAKLAEVLAKNRGIHKARYAYPNDELLQIDEKERANAFLNDWLRLCVIWGKVENR